MAKESDLRLIGDSDVRVRGVVHHGEIIESGESEGLRGKYRWEEITFSGELGQASACKFIIPPRTTSRVVLIKDNNVMCQDTLVSGRGYGIIKLPERTSAKKHDFRYSTDRNAFDLVYGYRAVVAYATDNSELVLLGFYKNGFTADSEEDVIFGTREINGVRIPLGYWGNLRKYFMD